MNPNPLPRTVRRFGDSRLALLGVLALALAACDNEVELLDASGSVPIVFGVYNQSADEQLVSVTRTFRFSDGGSARASAANPDSVYYPETAVQVRATTDNPPTAAQAERVDLSAEGVVRESGPFPTAPNVYYRYDLGGLGLETGDSFNLDVIALAGDTLLARATGIRLPDIEFPRTRVPPDRYAITAQNDFSTSWVLTQDGFDDLIDLYEVGFVFAFTENGPGGLRFRELYWPAAQNLTDGKRASIDLKRLFGFLRSELEVDPAVTRRFRFLQLVITGGDQAFADYQQLLVANSGITSTQELPPFTNVEGGLGLFGSVTQFRQDTSASLSTGGFDALYARDGDPFEMIDYNFQP